MQKIIQSFENIIICLYIFFERKKKENSDTNNKIEQSMKERTDRSID